MRQFFIFLLLLFSFAALGQAPPRLRLYADTIDVRGNMLIKNSTQHIKGFLVNMGNGVTEFKKIVGLTDSTFLAGEDTVLLRGVGGVGSVETATSLGTGYPVYKNKAGAQFQFYSLSSDSSIIFNTGTNELMMVVDPGKFSSVHRLKDSIAALRAALAAASSQMVTNISRTPGVDSISFVIGGVTFKIKDSTGGAGGNQFPGFTVDGHPLGNSPNTFPTSEAVFNAIIQGGTSQLVQITLSSLDGASALPTDKIYYVTDNLKQGEFIYIGTVANQNLDDGGMNIVTADLKHFRRIVRAGYIDPKWFGAVADDATDCTPAMHKAFAAAASNQLVQLDVYPGGTRFYFASDVNIGANGNSKRYNVLVNANTRHAANTKGFVLRGNYPKLRHWGTHSGSNSGGVFVNYTGSGFTIRNADHATLEVGEVINFRNGIHLHADTTGSNPYGVQYAKVHFKKIYWNYNQILLQTSGSAGTNGQWINQNQFFCGQMGNANSPAGGTNGVVFDKDATSNQGDPFNGNIWWEPGFEGLLTAITIEHASNNKFISGRIEGNGVDGDVLTLMVNGLGSPATVGVAGDAVGTQFIGWNYFDEKWLRPGFDGVRTAFTGTKIYSEYREITPGVFTGGNIIGEMMWESYTPGRHLAITNKWGLSAFTIDTLNPTDILSLTGRYRTVQAMTARFNNKLRHIGWKGQYQFISASSTADTIQLLPNIGYLRINHTGTKVFKIDAEDLVISGETFFIDNIGGGTYTFIRSDNNTVVIPAGTITTAGSKWSCTWSEGGYRIYRDDGSSAPGSGDVTSNTSTSVDGELVVFNSITGKQIKRFAGTGFLKATSGVVSAQAKINIGDLNTTGTASGSTYLRGDGVWATVAGGSSQWSNLPGGIGYEQGVGVGILPSTFYARLHLAASTTGLALIEFGPSSVYASNPRQHTLDYSSTNGLLRLTPGSSIPEFVKTGSNQINITGGRWMADWIDPPFGGVPKPTSIHNRKILTNDGSQQFWGDYNTTGVYYATLDATSTSFTTALTLPHLLEYVEMWDIQVVGRGTNVSQANDGFVKHFRVRSQRGVSGPPSLGTIKEYYSDTHADMTGCDATIVVSGNDLAVQVKGTLSLIRWTVYVSKVSSYPPIE